MRNGRKIMSWGIKVVFKISLVGGSVLKKKKYYEQTQTKISCLTGSIKW